MKSKLVGLFALMSHFLLAHDGSIKGAIYDANSNLPLQGASVILKDIGKGTSSGIFGIYEFNDVPAGNYIILISFIGYASIEIQTDVKENETTVLSSYLISGTLELSEIIVQSDEQNSLITISRLDLALKPIRTSQDLLRSVPGLFIAQHAGGGKAEQIFLRGFDIDHGTDINLSVDGMPVNMVSHAHGQGYSDLHFVIPETAEKLNFGKGPYDARFGNFSTAGYADFQTLNSLDQSSFKFEAGAFDSYRSVLMLDLLGDRAKSKKQGAYMASEYSFTNGYFESPQNFTRLNLFGKYRGILDEDKILSVSLSTFQSKWDASGQIPERAVQAGLNRFGSIDPTEGGSTGRSNLNIELLKNLPGDALLRHRAYYINYDFELYSNFTFFLHDNVNGDQIRQKEGRQIFGYSGSYHKNILVRNSLFRTEAGGGLRYDVVEGAELSRTKSRRMTIAEIKNGDIGETNAFAYLDGILEFSSQFNINAGLRYDQFLFDYTDNLDTLFSRKAVAKGTLSQKLNFQYTVSPQVQYYIKTGISFHSNDTRVVVAQDGKAILPKAYGADIGSVFKPHPRIVFNTAAWILDLDQEFVYVGDEGIVEPSGKTRRYGLDLSGRFQVASWLYADIDVNFSKPRSRENPEGENYIPLAPIATSIGGLTFKMKSDISGSMRYRYLSNRPANENYSIIAKGYNIVDIVLRYSKVKYDVMISAENLFNQEWSEAQFDTESRLRNEADPVSEIHFTPGTPLFVKASMSYKF
ncbi:MAG: TonB-dependent receptor [Cyclobacteriaceae bacterium]